MNQYRQNVGMVPSHFFKASVDEWMKILGEVFEENSNEARYLVHGLGKVIFSHMKHNPNDDVIAYTCQYDEMAEVILRAAERSGVGVEKQ